MSSVAFVMPAHGRYELSALCMRSLARGVETLRHYGISAAAFVVSDEMIHLRTALELGFGAVEQENAPLGRKFNDGYQAATDPDVIDDPFDYVIPIGSDDWIDVEILLELHETELFPADDEIVCFTRATFVSEDGARAAPLRITYPGGLGIRIIPRALLETTGFRPVAEHRMRAIDASTLTEIREALRKLGRPAPRLRYQDFHPAQIVDWKSRSEQLNPFETALRYLDGHVLEIADLADALGLVYGDDHVEEMLELYAAGTRT